MCISSVQTIVIFCGPDPIKKGTIREIYTRLGNEKFTRLILVLQSKITSGARDALKDLFSNKFETFHVSSMFVYFIYDPYDAYFYGRW